jgi:hypothetical protein
VKPQITYTAAKAVTTPQNGGADYGMGAFIELFRSTHGHRGLRQELEIGLRGQARGLGS